MVVSIQNLIFPGAPHFHGAMFVFREFSLLMWLMWTCVYVFGAEDSSWDIPIGSMYGIFTYIWLVYGKCRYIYQSHGSYGIWDLPAVLGEKRGTRNGSRMREVTFLGDHITKRPFGSLENFLKLKTSWWFQPNWKILVKLDHFPRDRGENKKSLKPPARKSRWWLHWFLFKGVEAATSQISQCQLPASGLLTFDWLVLRCKM